MARKQKCPEFENHERWLVSFADMMTLLFALFVVLFTLKDGSESPEMEQVAASVSESFDLVLEDIPVDRRIGPTEAGFGIFEHFHGDSVLPQITRRFPGTKERIKVINDEFHKVSAELRNRLYGDKAMREADKPGRARVVSVHRDQDGFRVRMLATHFFQSGSYRLKSEAKKELDSVADILKDLGRNVTVQGHTDSMPARGRFTNWELSSLRAAEVVRYFIQKHGFPATTVAIAGYADTKPIADNSTASGRKLNRRIEVKVHYND